MSMFFVLCVCFGVFEGLDFFGGDLLKLFTTSS